MTAFYVSIILVGILIVLMSLICILHDKKTAHDYRTDLDRKKSELMEVIEDAEVLLDELNRFSDYILNKIDDKNKEINSTFSCIEEKFDLFNNLELSKINNTERNNNILDNIVIPFDEIIEKSEENRSKNKKKIVPFEVKRDEVIKLKNSGFNSTEIAKRLNMGKGEIELITRMCK